MTYRKQRSLSLPGLAAALLAPPLLSGAEGPTAATEAANVATSHLFNAMIYLPVGLIAGAMLLEYFAHWKKNREVEPAILFLLFGAAGAAAAVAVLALAFSPVGREDGRLNQFAMWMGIVAASVGLAFYLKRQARNRRFFSLRPVPALSGRISIPRTAGEKGLIVGYRAALILSFLLSIAGVSELPLSHAPTKSVTMVSQRLWNEKEALFQSASSSFAKTAPAAEATPATAEAGLPPALPSEEKKPKESAAASSPQLAALIKPSDPAAAPAELPTPAVASSGIPASAAMASAASATPPPEAANTPAPTASPASPSAATSATVPVVASSKPGGSASKLPPNFFATKIKPILDSKCVDCHGSKSQKGDLRLDSIAEIRKGAGHPVVVPGDLELSTVYMRLISPDDEDVMPPSDKGGPLPPETIALFKTWILAGADYGDGKGPTHGAGAAPAIAARPGGRLEEEKSRNLPPPDPAIVDRLIEGGASIRPLSANGALLDINLSHYEAGPIDLSELAPIAQNIHTLDLSKSGVKDEDLAPLAGMARLTRLDLKRNALTDAALAHLRGLTELEYLNLYDTQVSDAGLEQLTGLKKLQKIFLFNTQCTAAGADRLRAQIPSLVVNLGL